MLEGCTRCPRKCRALRDNDYLGACLATKNVRLRFSLVA